MKLVKVFSLISCICIAIAGLWYITKSLAKQQDHTRWHVDFDTSLQTARYPECINSPWGRQVYAVFKTLYDRNNLTKVDYSPEPRIPKIMHQIWIGSPLPEKYKILRESWKKYHPDWEFKLWTDKEIEELGLQNKALYDASINYGERADIARYEILCRFGGLYFDTDQECLQAMDMFNHCYDFYIGIQPLDTKCLQLGSLMACRPGHPLMKAIVDGLPESARRTSQIIVKTGPIYLTNMFVKHALNMPGRIIAFPPTYFFPCGYDQDLKKPETWRKPESFSVHHWHGSWLKDEAFVPGTLHRKQPNFFIVIPTYNNEKLCLDNINSVIHQKYPHWRAYIINDVSTDKTGEILEEFIKKANLQDKITLINNKIRKKALQNIWETITTYCPDDWIVITLDGDDEFAHANVLDRIALEYLDPNVWLTYGQYRNHPSGQIGICRPLPQDVIEQNAFRQYHWVASHPRTFIAKLFKKIKPEDLKIDGKFFPTTWDQAMMFPMLEMAAKGGHVRCIPDVLYIYNETPLNDYKLYFEEQQRLELYIRAMPRYEPIKDLN